MEQNEEIRQNHKPDWLPVFLGTVVNFAIMGILAMIGSACRLLDIHPSDSLFLIVVELFWLIGSVIVATFSGGFVTGLTQGARSVVAAALNGLLVTQMTILLFFIAGFCGLPVLPGVTFSLNPGGTSSEGLIWWVMMLSLPGLFASMFGAMAGNRFVARGEGPGGVEAEAAESRKRAA